MLLDQWVQLERQSEMRDSGRLHERRVRDLPVSGL